MVLKMNTRNRPAVLGVYFGSGRCDLLTGERLRQMVPLRTVGKIADADSGKFAHGQSVEHDGWKSGRKAIYIFYILIMMGMKDKIWKYQYE